MVEIIMLGPSISAGAAKLVSQSVSLGNRLSIDEAIAAILAAQTLRENQKRLGPQNLQNLDADERQLARTIYRVHSRATGIDHTPQLRELHRLEEQALKRFRCQHESVEQSPALSERAWIEANGY